MYKKKPFFVVFEGIEGSGKSYHCKALYRKLINLKVRTIITREPGGSKNCEQIRKFILSGKKNKFNANTDTLLYLADRSEHIQKIIIPSLKKKKVLLCDRFIDSTYAYQVQGYNVNKNLVDSIHENILSKVKPNLTFLLTVNINESIKRIKKRGSLNRYDKLSKDFYNKVQKKFINLANKNKKKYVIIDTSKNIKFVESAIYNKFISFYKK